MTARKLPQILSISDIVKMSTVSRRQVMRWIDSGALPAAKIGGRVLIEGRDFAEFFNRHKSRRPLLSIGHFSIRGRKL